MGGGRGRETQVYLWEGESGCPLLSLAPQCPSGPVSPHRWIINCWLGWENIFKDCNTGQLVCIYYVEIRLQCENYVFYVHLIHRVLFRYVQCL